MTKIDTYNPSDPSDMLSLWNYLINDEKSANARVAIHAGGGGGATTSGRTDPGKVSTYEITSGLKSTIIIKELYSLTGIWGGISAHSGKKPTTSDSSPEIILSASEKTEADIDELWRPQYSGSSRDKTNAGADGGPSPYGWGGSGGEPNNSGSDADGYGNGGGGGSYEFGTWHGGGDGGEGMVALFY